jgi:carbamoyl-phosphate synthase large subunit
MRPANGSSSIGARRIDVATDVNASDLSDDRMIFSEYIDQTFDEYTIDCYFDRTERLRCWVPRLRIQTRAGEIAKGVTRRNFVYDALASRLPLLTGARGCITVQLFAREQDRRLLGIEINPRFGGGFPLSYAAGANFPGWLIQEYLLERPLDEAGEWEADLLMLRYDAKVLVKNFA